MSATAWICIGVLVLLTGYFVREEVKRRASARINSEIVEREMNKVLDRANAELKAEPSAEAPLSEEKVNETLERLRALGRKPL